MSPFASIQTPFKVPVNAGALLPTGSNARMLKKKKKTGFKTFYFFSINIFRYVPIRWNREPLSGTEEHDVAVSLRFHPSAL